MMPYQTEFSREEIILNRKMVNEMITLHPEKHNQGDWVHILKADGGYEIKGDMLMSELADNCGTQCCLAGWTAVLTLPRDLTVSQFGGGYAQYACSALGIDRSVASWLFYDTSDATAREFMQYLVDHPESDGYERAPVH
jgi:hypothetical protein